MLYCTFWYCEILVTKLRGLVRSDVIGMRTLKIHTFLYSSISSSSCVQHDHSRNSGLRLTYEANHLPRHAFESARFDRLLLLRHETDVLTSVVLSVCHLQDSQFREMKAIS